jgi:hypothetical protein
LRRVLIRSEATDPGINLWILLDEWQGGLPPTRWAARERAPSPEGSRRFGGRLGWGRTSGSGTSPSFVPALMC